MSRQSAEHYRKIVERVEQLSLTELEESVHIDDICQAAAVSERTLRSAFHFIYGIPPYRYLRSFRMNQARRALLAAAAEPGVVTQIATRFGFFELGRFAVEYRTQFGECPSATLRNPQRPIAAAARKRGARLELFYQRGIDHSPTGIAT